jgi:hypothetical protein
MVSLHIAVIIGTRHIGWIQVHEIHSSGLEAKHVGTFDGVSLAIIESHLVEYRDLFRKMLLHGQAKIAPPVIIV